MSSLFGWNNVSLTDSYIFLLICVIIYLFIFYIMGTNLVSINLQKKWDNLQDKCFMNCNKKLCKKITKLRDKKYLNNSVNIDLKICMITSWELTHLFFHAFIGYYYNIYFSVITSILFEILEHYVHECGSYLDLFWNFMGFLIGFSLK